MYQSQAKGLASLGRGDDSVLVHMTPGEVQGLQKLAMSAGGSLTINPQTGLPEAGFLSSMLPTLVGLGVTAMSGGTIPGWMIGAGVGGITALATGSLSKGLLTGLGVYGGTQLGGALQGMGLNTAQQAAATDSINALNAVPQASQLAQQSATDSLVSQAAANPEAVMTPDAYREFLTKQASSTVAPTAEQLASAQAQRADLLVKAGEAAPSATTQAALNRSPLDQTFAGAGQLGTTQGLKDLYKGIGNQGLMALAAPLVTDLMKPKTLNTADAAQASKATIRPYTYSQTANPEAQRQMSQFGFSKVPYFDQSYTAQPTFAAAEGGTVPSSDYYANLMSGTTSLSAPPPSADAMNAYLANLNASLKGAPQAATPAPAAPPAPSTGGWTYDPVTKTYTPPVAPPVNVNMPFTGAYGGEGGMGPSEAPEFGPGPPEPGSGNQGVYAKGGLAGLHHQTNTYAAGGRLLRGPGDGMSDSIPAVIQGAKPQRAALADGEFVIPADVVSHLGNGSTEAGSKHLYKMMDKIRRARTGNPKQGKQINPAQFMPA